MSFEKADRTELLCMGGLTAFMLLFTGCSLLISSNAAYRIITSRLFHLKTIYQEMIVPVFMTMGAEILLLILLSWAGFYLFKYLELPTVSVIVPLFILLNISVVFQNYVRRDANALKHFIFLLIGLLCLVLGLFLSKYVCYADAPRHYFSLTLLWLIRISSMGLLLWTVIAGYLLHMAVNGAYGIIEIPGTIFSITPVEWLKLFILLFTGTALVDLRLDRRLRKKFYFWMAVSILAVAISKDFGNLIILLFLMGLVLYLLDNKRTLFIAAFCLVLLVGLVFLLHSMDLLPSSLGYVIRRFESIFTAVTETTADSTRQSLLAALRDGIFGSGTDKKMYIDNVYAVYTDYAFIAIQAIFGIGISFIVIVCYMVLFYGLGVGYKDAGADPMLYVYANTLITVLAVQTIIHVAVNLNIFPYTGIVLPFISSGGTSTFMCFLDLGLALGVRMGDVPYMQLKRRLFRRSKRHG